MQFIDMHCDSLMALLFRDPEISNLYDSKVTSVDFKRMRESGQLAQFFAMFLPPEEGYAMIGMDHMSVNSIHHQGVKKPGKGLVITAVSKEEIPVVEALELPERGAFTLAVQWHPEELVDTQPGSFAVFRALISSCTSSR